MTRKKMSKLNVKIIQSSKFIHSEGNITVSLLIHASSVLLQQIESLITWQNLTINENCCFLCFLFSCRSFKTHFLEKGSGILYVKDTRNSERRTCKHCTKTTVLRFRKKISLLVDVGVFETKRGGDE